MKLIGFILFTFLLLACDNNKQSKRIRVSGEGKIRVMPDRVILNINVSFTRPRMADAVRLTQETIDTVLAILGGFGRKDEQYLCQ